MKLHAQKLSGSEVFWVFFFRFFVVQFCRCVSCSLFLFSSVTRINVSRLFQHRNETLSALLICLWPQLIFYHLYPSLSPSICFHLSFFSVICPSLSCFFLALSSVCMSHPFLLCLSVLCFVSLCLKLRDEVTKLKFEAKTFHIYANQKEVCVYIIQTLPFSSRRSTGS